MLLNGLISFCLLIVSDVIIINTPGSTKFLKAGDSHITGYLTDIFHDFFKYFRTTDHPIPLQNILL